MLFKKKMYEEIYEVLLEQPYLIQNILFDFKLFTPKFIELNKMLLKKFKSNLNKYVQYK